MSATVYVPLGAEGFSLDGLRVLSRRARENADVLTISTISLAFREEPDSRRETTRSWRPGTI
jgi:hypothetical protein